jgi:hypothetical protein
MEASKLLNDRITMQVAQAGFYDGARVELGASADGMQVVPILQRQVGFRASDTDPWTWIDADNLSTETLAPYRHGLFQARIVCDEQLGSPQQILDRLASFGVPIKLQGTYQDPLTDANNRVDIEHEFRLDLTLQRAGAKIGFNYAAKVLGADVIRKPAFDHVRRFVRYGEVGAGNPVRVGRMPVLAGEILDNDSSEQKLTRGHLCAVAWLPRSETLIALVKPFNEVTYGIALAAEDPSIVGVRFGHLFDPFNHTISEVPVPELL